MRQRRRRRLGLMVVVTAGLAVGCAPRTFVQQTPTWKSIELRSGITYETAWQEVVDAVAGDWDPNLIAMDSRYLRTEWKYGAGSGSESDYRARLFVKFPPGEARVAQMKCEAQWHKKGMWGNRYWVRGYDKAVLREMLRELAGRIGRTMSR